MVESFICSVDVFAVFISPFKLLRRNNFTLSSSVAEGPLEDFCSSFIDLATTEGVVMKDGVVGGGGGFAKDAMVVLIGWPIDPHRHGEGFVFVDRQQIVGPVDPFEQRFARVIE